MSSSPTVSTTSTSSSAGRVNYSDYVANITNSPRTIRKLAPTGIGHHINSPNNSHSNQPIQHTGTGHMPHYGGGGEKCARCQKNVYLAEKKIGAGRSFHSSCFSCQACHRKLDAKTLSEHKGEIYCKGCYTKHYGAHGLISGVTMSTESTTHETRHSRRSSFGSDLDAPVITYQQTRHRANSSENIIRDYGGTTARDDLSQKLPRRNDVVPGQQSPSSRRTNEFSAIGSTDFRRPSSPIRFEPTTNENRHQPIHAPDADRRQPISQGDKISRAGGASALVEIPVFVHPKRPDSTIERIVSPATSTKTDQQNRSRSPSPSRSPSITSNDSYQRQNSRERQIDPIDNYSRMTINENNRGISQRSNAHNNAIITIAPGSPLVQQNHYHSSSYESKYKSSTSTANNYNREQSHSRDSSPSATVNSHRSPSPTNSYISSSTGPISSSTYRDGAQRDSTTSPFAHRDSTSSSASAFAHRDSTSSSASAFAPRHEYHNIPISITTNPNDRRSTSPQRNERTPSALTDFMTKTNLAGNIPSPTGSKFSALGALAKPHYEHNSSDDEFGH